MNSKKIIKKSFYVVVSVVLCMLRPCFGNDRVTLICGSDFMQVFVKSDAEDLYVIGDSSCPMMEYNKTHHMREIGLSDCRNDYRRVGLNITITNILQPLIVTQRENVLSLKLTCVYPSTLRASLEDFPNDPQGVVSVQAQNQKLLAAIDLFQDATYTSPYASQPTYSVEDTIHVAMYLLGKQTTSWLNADTCWLDTRQDPTLLDARSITSDLLVYQSCPVGGTSQWFRMSDNGVDQMVKVSIDVAGLQSVNTEAEVMYFHCNVGVCDKPCGTNCTSTNKKRRDVGVATVNDYQDGTTSYNILSLKMTLPPKQVEIPASNDLQILFYALLGLLFLSCLIILFVTYRWWLIRRDFRLHRQRATKI